jgi:hypothetical protein
MHLEKYQYNTGSSFLDFEFESCGPNGRIKKVVSYIPQFAHGIKYFNLGFGDWDPQTGDINDLCISNNGDKDKILATIAATVLEFLSRFPDAMIYALGSTMARTRLYQMGIAANWPAIDSLLDVYGFIDNRWVPFKPNVNYKAFLVLRKKL